MKQLSFLLLVLLLSSCCATKQVVNKQEKEVTQVETKAEVEVELKNEVEVELENDVEKVLTEVKNEVEIKKDSTIVNNEFHQKLTKRMSTNVHLIWDELLKANVSNQGNVDYKAFKENYKKLLGYFHILNLMKSNKQFESFSRNEKLAFWINAYNAFTVDLIIRNYPVKSIKDIKDPWKQRYWKLGEKWYNLDEIEHQILRKMKEPRIHFAIVCASYSCPKLQNEAFTTAKLDTQLTNATTAFLADKNRNSITQNSLRLSKIFQWFAKDFKQDGSLIDFLNKYTEVQISSKAKKSFKTYNWNLND
ncbi:MAG: DUF547 domain-containing protein [Oceanihabitans sp.]